MRKILLLALLAAFPLLGCQNMDWSWSPMERRARELDTWRGASRAEIISAWGAPSQEVEDGQGGTILVYDRGSSVHAAGAGTYATAHTLPHSTQFYLDPAGTVYKWRDQ